MRPRHLGREVALKALYQMDISGNSSPEALRAFFESFPVEERARQFARMLVEGVRREQAALDKQLAETIEHWSIERLSRIDHNILRLALYELIWIEDIPARVTFDEAIELAKRYGDRQSGAFVNGVLDEVAGRLGLKSKGEETGAAKPR